MAVTDRLAGPPWMIMCAYMLALVALGCGRGDDRAYSRESTVIVATSEGAEDLNPDFDHTARFLVFLPLVTYDENGELAGRLVERWEHSSDYRTWTFHLRQDVRWHDGVPVTAHDIKFTLELLTHPDVLELDPGEYESMTVLDDSTITIRYTLPTDALDGFTVYYPRHLLEGLDTKEAYAWEFWTHPVGNGPYRFVRYLPETMMEFEANPDFYKGKPKIERVVLKFTGDAGPGLTELLSGNVDVVMYANPAQIPMLAADPRFRFYHGINEGVARAIYWQHDHPLFRDARVRRALTLAINRRELLKVLNLPEDLPLVDGVYTRRQLRRGELPDPLPYDPSQARTLLDAAGWRDVDGDGVREREGKAARFTALVSTMPQFVEIGVYVQDQLRRVGVRMDVQYGDNGMILEKTRTGNFDAAFTFFVPGESNWFQRYFSEDFPLGYRNAEVLNLIDRAKTTGDPDAEDHIYRRLSEIFREDVPITLLFPRVEYTFVHRRIRGLSSPWRGNPVAHMEYLWLEDEN